VHSRFYDVTGSYWFGLFGLFSIIDGMSSFPLTDIFQRGRSTTNQVRWAGDCCDPTSLGQATKVKPYPWRGSLESLEKLETNEFLKIFELGKTLEITRNHWKSLDTFTHFFIFRDFRSDKEASATIFGSSLCA
jgi:hypothetical protein